MADKKEFDVTGEENEALNDNAFNENEAESAKLESDECFSEDACSSSELSDDGNAVAVKKNKLGNILGTVLIIVLSVILAMLVYGRIAYKNSYSIKGSSMTIEGENSLYTDGRVVYIDANIEPEHGSVIVVDDPFTENHPLIKRVVGLGGDKLWVEDGYICVLEKGATESYTITEVDGASVEPIIVSRLGNLNGSSRDNPLVVPEGHIYYVGDNRNNSSDCRMSGSVSNELIRGTVKGFVPWWYVIVLSINGLEADGR